MSLEEERTIDKTDLALRKNTLPQPVKKDGTMKIALETFYASVGEEHEQLGRTYLRIREIGTFTSNTPYPFIREKINEAVKEEQLRDKKMLDLIENYGEHRRQLLQR
ncbi:MAG: hypothetical protein ABSA11_09200 [Candidatus Bathyarchaeia archaeon]